MYYVTFNFVNDIGIKCKITSVCCFPLFKYKIRRCFYRRNGEERAYYLTSDAPCGICHSRPIGFKFTIEPKQASVGLKQSILLSFRFKFVHILSLNVLFKYVSVIY